MNFSPSRLNAHHLDAKLIQEYRSYSRRSSAVSSNLAAFTNSAAMMIIVG
jgi:hypothetical protein